MNHSNKLECSQDWKGLPKRIGPISKLRRKRSVVNNVYFLHKPDELKCYITLGWKSLPMTNALAYRAYSCVTNKIKCCEYGPWGV